MYSFLRRPVWILSHVLIAALIVSLVGLGLWQRARYYEEKDKQDRTDALASATPVSLDDVVDAGADPDDVPESARYRRVEVVGEYDVANEVLIRNRSRDGAPGAWVLTPLVQADGTAVPVLRGWVPLAVSSGDTGRAEVAPPEGEVAVTGNVQLTQARGSFGSVDPADGRLSELARVDLERLAQQLPYALAPAWVLLDAQAPPQPDELPAPVELITRDSSQNFSYMVQWWIFAAIALIGYPLVLRMVAGIKARGGRTPRGSVDDEVPWAEGLGPAAAAPAGAGDEPPGEGLPVSSGR
jgi:surfeit locus 1 family protein